MEILSGSLWKEVSVRVRFLVLTRVERNFTNSSFLPLIMKVMMSRKMQARDQISLCSGIAVGRSRRLAELIVEGRGRSRDEVSKDDGENGEPGEKGPMGDTAPFGEKPPVGEKGPVGTVGEGQVSENCREKLRVDVGEPGPDSNVGGRAVRIVVTLLVRPSPNDVAGDSMGLPMAVPPMKLLLRELPPEDSDELTVSMVANVLVLIFLNRENAPMLLTGGELDFRTTGLFEMCDSGAA